MQYFWTHKMFCLEMLNCVAVDIMISLKSDLLWLPFPCKIGYKLDATEGVYQIETYHIQHRYRTDSSKVISILLNTFDGCRPIIQYLVHWFYKLLSTQEKNRCTNTSNYTLMSFQPSDYAIKHYQWNIWWLHYVK